MNAALALVVGMAALAFLHLGLVALSLKLYTEVMKERAQQRRAEGGPS